MEKIEELAEEHGVQTDWTNDGKPYLMLCGQKDTEIYIPVESEENRMYMIYAYITSDYTPFAVSTWTYTEKDYDGAIPKLSPSADTDEQYRKFSDAVEDLEDRLKTDYSYALF
jgi:hypothetical protein